MSDPASPGTELDRLKKRCNQLHGSRTKRTQYEFEQVCRRIRELEQAAPPTAEAQQPISTLDIAKIAEATRLDTDTVARVLSALQVMRGGAAFGDGERRG